MVDPRAAIARRLFDPPPFVIPYKLQSLTGALKMVAAPETIMNL